MELVAPVSQRIKNCIFPEDGFGDTREGGIEETQTKERLRLARLLSEFINILRPRKSEENPKHPGIGKVVVEACDELCRAFENGNRTSVLYKINRQNLKALFTEVFGGERRYDKEVDCVSIICTDQAGERETRGFLTPTKQSECLSESLPLIPNRKEVYEPLLILLRRWLSGIGQKSALASCTLEIVRILFSVHSPKKGSELLEELHGIVQASVLSFKNNQALVAQLQAAGYNQKTQGALDLWCSPSVECAGYLSKREALGSTSLRKKLTEVLRRHWNEWKDILSLLNVASIKVGEADVRTKDLFGPEASLEEMEDQLSAVKTTVGPIESEDIERKVKQMMLQEKQHRARIEKLYRGKRVRRI